MLPKSINIDEASQVISTIVEKTEQMVKDTKQGKLNQVVIASQKGQLLFNEISTGVLFMLGDENINVGKMRLILKDVIEKIKKVAA
jgi:predicted regulator of Ras-like GTPase activity (Roadblock/LC7/MglB family)